jgi:hypothetical protein
MEYMSAATTVLGPINLKASLPKSVDQLSRFLGSRECRINFC